MTAAHNTLHQTRTLSPTIRAKFPHLTAQDIDAFGAALDAIREKTIADLGERDAQYIRKLMKIQRRCEVGGRVLLFAGILPPAWIAGTALLSVSKILENMEIGHNVMHGQYDFMKDPAINGNRYDWDNTCPGDTWRHSHNYMHHTYTNIVGKDRDVGYGILRMAEEQPWEPKYLGNPAYALALALLFQWGVGVHDIESDKVFSGEKSRAQALAELKVFWKKARKQVAKDYLLFPALAGPFFLPVLLGNATANIIRNLWAFTVIFCGHFPDGTAMFSEEECRDESRGQWYLRQLLGSANIKGGQLMHIMTGNLSHQIEHHLFPDIPGHRYAEIAPEVRALCEKYGLPYNSGSLTKQFGTVVRRIFALALPPQLVGGAIAPTTAR